MPADYKSDWLQTGIHLVSSNSSPRQNERRLTAGQYTADIVVSKREDHCCYYIIQRIGSAEIMEMQRFDTPENAEAGAKAALARWNRQDLLRRAAS